MGFTISTNPEKTKTGTQIPSKLVIVMLLPKWIKKMIKKKSRNGFIFALISVAKIVEAKITPASSAPTSREKPANSKIVAKTNIQAITKINRYSCTLAIFGSIFGNT